MKAKDLIEELKEVIKKYGNIKVQRHDSEYLEKDIHSIYVKIEPDNKKTIVII